ncbi:MAG: 4a-hydroxytetrahydrobiopterin dehydratase [Pseudomonadota bacterium]|nr:4a-hydroxytetrahydrobiopterin dehydratase [Pseudomonadota bacterium]
MFDLAARRCVSSEGGIPKLSEDEVRQLLPEVPGWRLNDGKDAIARTFSFRNFYETMAFVNALAWIAHGENHHPDLTVHYNKCVVRWNTHSVGGLSDNDFICAAKVSALLPDG